MPRSESVSAESGLPSIDAQPHARAVLEPALRAQGAPAHAYLFHGPAGTGKRAAARAFAGVLIAAGASDPDAVAERVTRGTHPDLTWVTPSGASELLVGDIEEPVVAAATRTPFESSRRVFVIEQVERMNDQAANRMLKTLEEPPDFVHLLLLSERPQDVLPTIASRCQAVRFDPLPSARIVERLQGGEPERLMACARLALGDARRAVLLASERGSQLRAAAEAFVRSALAGSPEERAWLTLLELARAEGALAGEREQERIEAELEFVPRKERRRHEREGVEARRRSERRARTDALEGLLRLAELWLRDVLCICEGAPELIYAVDRRSELEGDARGGDRACLCEAIELVADVRLRLAVNVSEELALESLAYRLAATLASATA